MVVELDLSAWRRRESSLGNKGFVDKEGTVSIQPRPVPIVDLGKVNISPNGNGNGNGHSKENPLETRVVYQALEKVRVTK